jgi:hypothetical protein
MTKGQPEQVTDAQTFQSTELNNKKLAKLLKNWIKEAGIDEEQKQSRIKAGRRILRAKKNNSESLDLSGLNLETLPPEIGYLVNLKSLNLSVNKLKHLPPEIGNLINLESLNLRENEFDKVPPQIESITQLKKLYLGCNPFNEISESIFNLKYLEDLDMTDMGKLVISPNIGKLMNLKSFHAAECKSVTIPDEMGALPNLTSIDLEGSKIIVFSEGFFERRTLMNEDRKKEGKAILELVIEVDDENCFQEPKNTLLFKNAGIQIDCPSDDEISEQEQQGFSQNTSNLKSGQNEEKPNPNPTNIFEASSLDGNKDEKQKREGGSSSSSKRARYY